MALLTNAALTGLRNYVKRTVGYARYKLNGSWVQTDLTSVETGNDGIVYISFMIQPAANTGTVTEVQIYDTAGDLWFDKTVSLDMTTVAEAFYYLVKITITEVDDE